MWVKMMYEFAVTKIKSWTVGWIKYMFLHFLLKNLYNLLI
jgi:hypothetical protein